MPTSTLSIAEFAGNLIGTVPFVLHLPPLVERVVELTEDPQLLELNAATTVVRLLADAPCAISSGGDATPRSMRLAPGVPESFGLEADKKLSVLLIGKAEQLPAAASTYQRKAPVERVKPRKRR